MMLQRNKVFALIETSTKILDSDKLDFYLDHVQILGKNKREKTTKEDMSCHLTKYWQYKSQKIIF